MSTTPKHEKHSFASDFRRNFLAGLFVLIPMVVTVWVVLYLFGLLSSMGRPLVENVATAPQQPIQDAAELRRHLSAVNAELTALEARLAPPKSDPTPVATARAWLVFFKDVVAFLIVVSFIYLAGWIANRVLGRRLLHLFDATVERIPLVKSIYGMMKQLLSNFQQRPDGVERVVLIAFPTPRVRAVGLVMKTFDDADTGRKVAAVYVPTAPSPTSGYLQLVPVDELTNTDWTVDEAMKFIVSGGAIGPATIPFDRSANPRLAAVATPAPTE